MPNLGAAFSSGIENFMAQRAAQKHQDLLDSLAQKREDRLAQADLEAAQERRDALQEHKADREEQAHARQLKSFEAMTKDKVKGDIPSMEEFQQAKDVGRESIFPAPPVTAPGMMMGRAEVGPTIEMDPNARPFIGSPAERQQSAKDARLAAYLGRPETPANVKEFIQAQTASGDTSLPPALFASKETEATQPVMRINPRTGKVEQIGQAPKGAHFVQEPAPPAAPAEDAALLLTDRGLDTAAKMYAKTGQLPPMGMGKEGAKVRTRVINRASDYDAGTDTFKAGTTVPDIAGQKATYESEKTVQTQLTKNLGAVKAFTSAAEKNADLLDKMLDKVPDTGSSFGNWLARGAATEFGSETMANYSVYRKSLQDEYARIISNPNLTGVLSDTARKEMETILDPNSPVKATRAALKALKAEAQNRENGLSSEIEATKQRIKGGPAETPKVKMSAEDLIKKYGG